MVRRIISCICCLMCCALCAAQVSVTNEHVVTVVNVNGAGGMASVQDAAMLGRIAKLEAGLGELRASVDGRLKAIESRAVREDAKEEKIAERLDKACVRADEFYGKRYEDLKNAHGRCITIVEVCLVVFTLFGVLLPLVVAMLQHRTFDGVVRVAKDKLGVELEAKISDVVFQTQIGNITAMGLSVSQAIEKTRDRPLTTDEEQMRCVFDLAVVILTLHLIFESAIKTKRARVVMNEVEKYGKFVSRWVDGDPVRQDVWHRAEAVMKNSVSRDAASASRQDYVELLGDNTDTFKWLSSFYERIAPWKFA